MTHPLGSVRFMTGLFAVATGTMLFGAGVFAGRALQTPSVAPTPPAASPTCDCEADKDDDADDLDVVEDLDDLPGTAAAPQSFYDRAVDAYVRGQYERARTLARAIPDVRGWRVNGAASCFLHDLKTARESYGHLDTRGRAFLKYVCARNHLTLP